MNYLRLAKTTNGTESFCFLEDVLENKPGHWPIPLCFNFHKILLKFSLSTFTQVVYNIHNTRISNMWTRSFESRAHAAEVHRCGTVSLVRLWNFSLRAPFHSRNFSFRERQWNSLERERKRKREIFFCIPERAGYPLTHVLSSQCNLTMQPGHARDNRKALTLPSKNIETYTSDEIIGKACSAYIKSQACP